MNNKLKEISKHNLILELSKKHNLKKINWNNNDEMVYTSYYNSINENNNNESNSIFVPRFSLKKFKNPIFSKFQPNKEFKYSRDLILLAMEYGMILQVQYRGDEDDFTQGRTRVIYPMCLGTSSKGKPLLRVYHLKGWSFSKGGNTDKLWRMFRTDRIMSVSFTGSFFRLAPEDYNANDKGMRGGIIKSVDINSIRKKQQQLADEGSIQNKKDITIDKKVTVIEVINTNSILDLRNPWENPNLEEDNKKFIRMTFLKSQTDNTRIAILGALGEKGNIVKVYTSEKFMGNFRVIKYTMGDGLGKPHLRQVEGESKQALMIFVKKRD